MALYCKVDCMLDSHPKIRKAGRLGREVFLFILRRHRALDGKGSMSIENVDPEYLADQLMMTCNEAVTGVTACVTSKLISVTASEVAIIGWDDDWSREPASSAERVAKHRKNKRLADDVTKCNVTDVNSNESNVREEKKREEQKREEREITRANVTVDSVSVALAKSETQTVWDYAGAVHAETRQAVNPNAPNWPALVSGLGASDLRDRIRECVDREPDRNKALQICKHAVDVCAARAKAARSMQYFTPARVFESKSFWLSAESTVEEQTKSACKKTAVNDIRYGRAEPLPSSAFIENGEQEF